MATFNDNFNRADGALGGNWSTVSGSPQIASNRLTAPGTFVAQESTVATANRLEVSCDILHPLGTVGYIGPSLKMNPGDPNGFWCRLYLSGGTYYFQLYKTESGVAGLLQQVSLGTTIVTFHHLNLVWDNGVVTATLDGSTTLTVNSVFNAGAVRAGCRGNGYGAQLDNFVVIGDQAAALSVSPEAIGNYGACSTVTLTGTSTSWTAGTPGTPTFTVDHGTISAQTINSETSATLTYCPGDYLGTVTFTDPSTAATDTALVTSNPAIVPYTDLCPFDEDFIATANATVIADNRGLPTLQSIIVPAAHGWSDVYLLEAIRDLWYSHFRPEDLTYPDGQGVTLLGQLLALIAGDFTPTVNLYTAARTTSIREELEAVRDRFFDPVSETYWTLSEVIASVKGLDNRSITQVYDLVDALQAGSNEDVLTWLNTYLGTTGPTLEQLGTMISDLATVAGYDLGDVLDAIAAIPGTDLTAITNKLNLIQPSEAADLTTITNQLTTIDGNVDDLENSLAAIRTGSNYTFQDILDAIAAITPGGPGESGPALSLWPGQENVTLGTELPLTDGMTVPGPLNGLIFTITASAPRAQKFMFGTVASWARVGQVLFVTDRGDYERGQTYGIDRHIVIPTTMTEAASALILVNSNWEGTVTPWTRT